MEIDNFGGIPVETFKTVIFILDNPKIMKCRKTQKYSGMKQKLRILNKKQLFSFMYLGD